MWSLSFTVILVIGNAGHTVSGELMKPLKWEVVGSNKADYGEWRFANRG